MPLSVLLLKAYSYFTKYPKMLIDYARN